MSLQPLIQSGMLQFSKKDVALLEQLRTYPRGHDDGLDALEMAVRMALTDTRGEWRAVIV